jgi:hypothetical protein
MMGILWNVKVFREFTFRCSKPRITKANWNRIIFLKSLAELVQSMTGGQDCHKAGRRSSSRTRLKTVKLLGWHIKAKDADKGRPSC